MAKIREPLQVSGRYVSNCADYLAITPAERFDEAVQSQPAAADYVLCTTIEALGRARPAALVTVPDATPGAWVYTRLDLGSFPSSFGPRLSESDRTIEHFAASESKVSEHTVTLDTAEWFFQVEVVAIADMNNNATADWLAWVTDTARQGTYNAHQLIVIYDPALQKGKLRAFVWSEHGVWPEQGAVD